MFADRKNSIALGTIWFGAVNDLVQAFVGQSRVHAAANLACAP